MNKLKIDFTFNGKQYKLSIDVEEAGGKLTPEYLESQMSLCGRYDLDVRPIDLLFTRSQYLSLPTLQSLNAEELQAKMLFFYKIQASIYDHISFNGELEKLRKCDDELNKMIISALNCGFANTRVEPNCPRQSHKLYHIDKIFESLAFRKYLTAFSIHVEQNK